MFHVEQLTSAGMIYARPVPRLFSFYGGHPYGAMCSVKYLGKISSCPAAMTPRPLFFCGQKKAPNEGGYSKISAAGKYQE